MIYIQDKGVVVYTGFIHKIYQVCYTQDLYTRYGRCGVHRFYKQDIVSVVYTGFIQNIYQMWWANGLYKSSSLSTGFILIFQQVWYTKDLYTIYSRCGAHRIYTQVIVGLVYTGFTQKIFVMGWENAHHYISVIKSTTIIH